MRPLRDLWPPEDDRVAIGAQERHHLNRQLPSQSPSFSEHIQNRKLFNRSEPEPVFQRSKRDSFPEPASRIPPGRSINAIRNPISSVRAESFQSYYNASGRRLGDDDGSERYEERGWPSGPPPRGPRWKHDYGSGLSPGTANARDGSSNSAPAWERRTFGNSIQLQRNRDISPPPKRQRISNDRFLPPKQLVTRISPPPRKGSWNDEVHNGRYDHYSPPHSPPEDIPSPWRAPRKAEEEREIQRRGNRRTPSPPEPSAVRLILSPKRLSYDAWRPRRADHPLRKPVESSSEGPLHIFSNAPDQHEEIPGKSSNGAVLTIKEVNPTSFALTEVNTINHSLSLPKELDEAAVRKLVGVKEKYAVSDSILDGCARASTRALRLHQSDERSHHQDPVESVLLPTISARSSSISPVENGNGDHLSLKSFATKSTSMSTSTNSSAPLAMMVHRCCMCRKTRPSSELITRCLKCHRRYHLRCLDPLGPEVESLSDDKTTLTCRRCQSPTQSASLGDSRATIKSPVSAAGNPTGLTPQSEKTSLDHSRSAQQTPFAGLANPRKETYAKEKTPRSPTNMTSDHGTEHDRADLVKLMSVRAAVDPRFRELMRLVANESATVEQRATFKELVQPMEDQVEGQKLKSTFESDRGKSHEATVPAGDYDGTLTAGPLEVEHSKKISARNSETVNESFDGKLKHLGVERDSSVNIMNMPSPAIPKGPIAKTRGRPRKYANEEERKPARKAARVESKGAKRCQSQEGPSEANLKGNGEQTQFDRHSILDEGSEAFNPTLIPELGIDKASSTNGVELNVTEDNRPDNQTRHGDRAPSKDEPASRHHVTGLPDASRGLNSRANLSDPATLSDPTTLSDPELIQRLGRVPNACENCRRKKIRCRHHSKLLPVPGSLNSLGFETQAREDEASLVPLPQPYKKPACRECRRLHRRCTHDNPLLESEVDTSPVSDGYPGNEQNDDAGNHNQTHFHHATDPADLGSEGGKALLESGNEEATTDILSRSSSSDPEYPQGAEMDDRFNPRSKGHNQARVVEETPDTHKSRRNDIALLNSRRRSRPDKGLSSRQRELFDDRTDRERASPYLPRCLDCGTSVFGKPRCTNCESIEREKPKSRNTVAIPETPEVTTSVNEKKERDAFPQAPTIASPTPSTSLDRSILARASSTRESSTNSFLADSHPPSHSVMPRKRKRDESTPDIHTEPQGRNDKLLPKFPGPLNNLSKAISTMGSDSADNSSPKDVTDEANFLHLTISDLRSNQSQDTLELERLTNLNLHLQLALEKSAARPDELAQSKYEIANFGDRMRARSRDSLQSQSGELDPAPDPNTYYPPKETTPKPRRDPAYRRPDMSLDLYEVAPELLLENVFFDPKAKIREIEARPSRKATFGKLLANTRKERGGFPHREIQRCTPPPLDGYWLREKNADEEQDADGDVDMEGEKYVKEHITIEEFMGAPENPIPVRVGTSLAYRDGTRDARGRLPRAKQVFKVGRKNAGNLD